MRVIIAMEYRKMKYTDISGGFASIVVCGRRSLCLLATVDGRGIIPSCGTAAFRHRMRSLTAVCFVLFFVIALVTVDDRNRLALKAEDVIVSTVHRSPPIINYFDDRILI